MPVQTTIQEFTEVYKEQGFMQEMKHNVHVLWLDCTQIGGTDCYCDDEAQSELGKKLDQSKQPGIHFFDNGNYHYMSKLWTDRIDEPFDLVIFDHHPDMQPPRFEGILSCGGWVKEVFDCNPYIKNAILVGVADHLIEEIKNDPTAEFEKYRNRVKFIPESALLAPKDWPEDEAFAQSSRNVYISIDKDALCLKDAITNWDQGSLTFDQLEKALRQLFAHHRILGVDICGERARNQDYPNGIDEGVADRVNSKLNEQLYRLLQGLFGE